MSNAAADVEVRVKFVDQNATSGIDRYTKHLEKSVQRTEQLVNQSNQRQRSSYERLSYAREELGVRSEHTIQREIQQTEAAYKRLERSGTMSQEALSKAAEKTQAKISRLTNEMGKLTAAQVKAAKEAAEYEKIVQRINGIRTTVKAGAIGGAGFMAAGYALKSPVDKALSFDEQLMGVATTAYSGRDVAGIKTGAKEIERVINGAVDLKRGGAGTRDDALDAFADMVSKNQIGDVRKASEFLPTVMRTAYGSGAKPVDIAQLASSLYGQHVVNNDHELKTALNMVTAAGQAGGFEIKDMARYLPGQLALGNKAAGLTGLSGLQKILTMNQAAILSATGPEEAARNVSNLLNKVNSSDTAKDFEKHHGGNLSKYLIDQRINGLDSVDAWVNLIDQEAEKSPLLKQSLAKLKHSKNKDEKRELIDSISNLSEGSVIGQYFQDAQARSALFVMLNEDLVKPVNSFVGQNRKEYGVNDVNYEAMSTTGAAAVRNAEQEAAIKQKEAMEKLIPTIVKVADMFVDLSQKYPNLSTAVVGATGPVIALGTAAGFSALALGGGKGVSNSAFNKYAGKIAKGGLLGIGLLGAGQAVDALAPKDSAFTRYGNSLLTYGGIGAMAGSVIPGVGTGIGSLIGAVTGLLTQAKDDLVNNFESNRVEAKADITVGLAPGLVLQKQTVQNNGLNMTLHTGNIWNGAP